MHHKFKITLVPSTNGMNRVPGYIMCFLIKASPVSLLSIVQFIFLYFCNNIFFQKKTQKLMFTQLWQLLKRQTIEKSTREKKMRYEGSDWHSMLRSIESTLALDCCAFRCVRKKTFFSFSDPKQYISHANNIFFVRRLGYHWEKIIEMGNKSSLLLRQEEIAQIQDETGCE